MLASFAVWLAANVAGLVAVENLQYPQVEHDVQSMITEYQHYASYKGPTGTALVI